MRTRLMAAALCLLGRLVCAQDAEPPPLALHEYIGELRGIEDAVRAADLDPARARALALAERRVQSGDVVFHADRSLLEPLARAASLKSADAQVARLRRLITALENLQATSAAQAPRPELLNGLLPSDTLQKGGRIARVEIQDLSTLDRVLSLYQQMMDWLRARWRKLRAWLKKFWPQREMRVGETGSVNVSVLITITILTIVLILLAIRTLRRSRSAIPAAQPSVAASRAADDDPLSRDLSEWQRYAVELGAAGRLREAIRAWYHAVLVALFGAGRIHYQKGRTNWEYAAHLSPEIDWRAQFFALTRLFDREWYGRERSSAEAMRECAQTARAILRAVRAGEEGA